MDLRLEHDIDDHTGHGSSTDVELAHRECDDIGPASRAYNYWCVN
jgi:hypothetical protein